MATNILYPEIQVYQEVNSDTFNNAKDYELKETRNGIPQLLFFINVIKKVKPSKSDPDYWLKISEESKWIEPRFTRLFYTDLMHVFKGDSQIRNNLILFDFSRTDEKLIVHYFDNYFQKRNTRDLIDALKYVNIE